MKPPRYIRLAEKPAVIRGRSRLASGKAKVRRAAAAQVVVRADVRPTIPPGLPLVWVPGLVIRRLQSLEHLLFSPEQRNVRFFPRDGREPSSAAVRAWAEDAGIVWRARSDGLMVPKARCPRCRRLVLRLIAEGGRWRCSGCSSVGGARRWSLVADYACGLRLGCRGLRMRARRRTLLRMAARLARTARKPAELVVLAQIAALVPTVANEKPKPWSRLTRTIRPCTLERGPFRLWAEPYVIPAAIDSFLHHAAYLERFGGGDA